MSGHKELKTGADFSKGFAVALKYVDKDGKEQVEVYTGQSVLVVVHHGKDHSDPEGNIEARVLGSNEFQLNVALNLLQDLHDSMPLDLRAIAELFAELNKE